jgi:hypothetical protein
MYQVQENENFKHMTDISRYVNFYKYTVFKGTWSRDRIQIFRQN